VAYSAFAARLQPCPSVRFFREMLRTQLFLLFLTRRSVVYGRQAAR